MAFGLNGPNIWANSPVLEAWVDLGRFEELPTDKLPGFSERLRTRQRWYFALMGTCLVLILLGAGATRERGLRAASRIAAATGSEAASGEGAAKGPRASRTPCASGAARQPPRFVT